MALLKRDKSRYPEKKLDSMSNIKFSVALGLVHVKLKLPRNTTGNNIAKRGKTIQSIRSLMKDIEIAKILYLAKNQKYEVTCATFDAVDHIFKLDIPRNLKGRKPAVQALTLMADGGVKYGYEKKPTVADEEE